LLSISPVLLDSSQKGAGFADSDTLWTGPVPALPTTTSSRYVRLDGTVEFYTAGAQITFDLTGYLDGVADASTGVLTATTAMCPVLTICSVASLFDGAALNVSNGEKTANTSISESLFFSVSGGVRYSASSPIYDGVPEPAPFALVGASLLFLGLTRRCGREVRRD